MKNTCDTCRFSVWVRRTDLRLSCLERPFGSDTVRPHGSCDKYEADTEPKDKPEAPVALDVVKAHAIVSPKDDGSYEDDTYSLGTL